MIGCLMIGRGAAIVSAVRRTKKVVALSMVVVACSAAAAPTTKQPAPVAVPPVAAPAVAEPAVPCDAGSLPRVDESKIQGGKTALLKAAARSSVAVVWDDKTATIVEDCRLPSGYVPLEARKGTGTFYAVGRVFFRPEEIPEPCRTATHLVAALATWDEHAAAILLPLPCPSVTDEKPAKGCVGRTKTGRQRAAAAQRLITTRPLSEGDQNPGLRLAAWALAPDSSLGLRPLFYRQGDDLSRRSRWLMEQYDFAGIPETTTTPARLRPVAETNAAPSPAPTMAAGMIDRAPLFRGCFLPQVDPKFTQSVVF